MVEVKVPNGNAPAGEIGLDRWSRQVTAEADHQMILRGPDYGKSESVGGASDLICTLALDDQLLAGPALLNPPELTT